MEKGMIDLNAHRATLPCSMALEWMRPYLESHHPIEGDLLEQRAERVRALVGAGKEERLFFTSCGAEAINQVLWSVFLEVARKEGKTHFVTSCLEDAPTLQMMKRLEELGCFVKVVPANERGEVDLDRLREAISPRTALLSLSVAQGVTGVIQPVEEIIRLAREKKVLLHLEASHAVGKYDFSGLQADYLTFSGDQIHSVPGTGALIAKAESPLVPLIFGKKGEAGPSMALCAAAHQAALFLDAMSLEVARLRDTFERELEKLGASPAFATSLRLPNTSTLFFPRVHQEALLYFLNRKGVLASIGGDNSQRLDRLLVASKCDEERAQTAVSFSLSRMTSEEEITRAAQIVAEVVRDLQKISEDLF